MIGVSINDQFLSLESGLSLGIDITNPIFESRQIRDVITYPFSVSLQSRTNRKLLGWPHRIAAIDKPETISDAKINIQNTLWKVGVLKYRGQSGSVASYNFQADSGEFASLIEGVKLRELDLGSYAFAFNLDAAYPAQKYATPTIYNPKFFGTKNADYLGYINYSYNSLWPDNSTVNKHVWTAMPYLMHVLHTMFELYGYRITGSLLTDTDAGKIIMHSNFADILMPATEALPATIVNIAEHMPDMTVSQFLISIKNLLGVVFIFDSQNKTVHTISYNEISDNGTYDDWTRKAAPNYSDSPVDYKGYSLRMGQDRSDDFLDELGNDWLEERIGQGVENIDTDAAPLHTITETDTINAGREWTIPAIKQSGSSGLFDLGINKHALRLMYYQGAFDPAANATHRYGLANYTGTNYDLRWQGANGLYEKRYKSWLDFMSSAIPVQRKVSLNLADIRNLDYTRKVMIDHVKYYWTSIRLNATQKGLTDATVSLIKA